MIPIMATPNVLVLHNQPLSPHDHPAADSEQAIVEIAHRQSEILRGEGFHTQVLALGMTPDILWTELKSGKHDVVLNLYEGTLDDPESESYIAGLLQWSGVPFTGCPMPALALARAKHTSKMVLHGAGLPTARFIVVEREPIPPMALKWPVIVKPATQDASVGIENDSVCADRTQVEAKVRDLLARFDGPVVVEEYIEGREIMVAMIELPELVSLPPAEVLFDGKKPGDWNILTYSLKWNPESVSAPSKFPADLDAALAERLGDLARRAYRVLGARDYARVDFRVDQAGQPFILELNPNPEISEGPWFGSILASAGHDYRSILVRIVRQALTRRSK